MPQKKFSWWTGFAFTVAILGNLLAAAFPVYSLLQIPPGSGVRLMGEAFHSALVSLAVFVLVQILGIVALCRERHRIFAVVTLCLSLTPFFFAGWMMRHVADIRHIVLEP